MNGNVITCSVNGGDLDVVSGSFTYKLQSYVTSGKSYEMIDIGDGFYTIQAT